MSSIFRRFPDITCVGWTVGKYPPSVRLRDGSERPATELEILWYEYPPEDGIEILEALNQDEADVDLCERCHTFHPDIDYAPVRTMYADGDDPQPLLCPFCVEEWNDMWDEMWKDYYSGCL